MFVNCRIKLSAFETKSLLYVITTQGLMKFANQTFSKISCSDFALRIQSEILCYPFIGLIIVYPVKNFYFYSSRSKKEEVRLSPEK